VPSQPLGTEPVELESRRPDRLAEDVDERDVDAFESRERRRRHVVLVDALQTAPRDDAVPALVARVSPFPPLPGATAHSPSEPQTTNVTARSAGSPFSLSGLSTSLK